jgi:hypothetical protein
MEPHILCNDVNHAVKTEIKDANGQTASLSIYFDFDKPITHFLPQHPHRVPFNPAAALPGQAIPMSIAPIVFERNLFTGEDSTLYGNILENGHIHFDQGRELGTATEFFPSTWQLTAVQVANWYSQLSIANQEREIIEAIKDLFGEIEDLSVQSLQFPALYATIKHRSRKIPVSLVSAGIPKFISILVAVRSYSPGVVLIDEIENSIYYKMFPALWEMLYKFAIRSGTQLFLTTHSLECLKHAVPLMRLHSEDFNLIQVLQEQGVSGATVLPGDEAVAAIQSDLEVRG